MLGHGGDVGEGPYHVDPIWPVGNVLTKHERPETLTVQLREIRFTASGDPTVALISAGAPGPRLISLSPACCGSLATAPA